jgi:MoxR-like ATPase
LQTAARQPAADPVPVQRVVKEVARRLVGQEAMVERLLVGLLTGGHVLLEGVPGLAKTLAVRTLAHIIAASFSRIQFTPDLLPADVTGTMVYDQKTQEFHVKKGPLFANINLADEINRAPAKTQAALLEAMEEQQITVDGTTHDLPNPFIVLATQNPIEYEGTFPLPESQLDRFMLRVRLGYPKRDEEMSILERQQHAHPVESLVPVTSEAELLEVQRAVREVTVVDYIRRYIVDLANATRSHPDVYVGASPRASLSLMRAAQARALLNGETKVIPDDVKALAAAVFSHRIIVLPSARVKDVTGISIVEELTTNVPVPGSRVAV